MPRSATNCTVSVILNLAPTSCLPVAGSVAPTSRFTLVGQRGLRLLAGALLFLERAAVEVLQDQQRRLARERLRVAGEFVGGRARRQQRDDLLLGQRRVAGERDLRVFRAAGDEDGHEVIADRGGARQVEHRVERLVGREGDVAVADLQAAEGQRGDEVLDFHVAVEQRLAARAAHVQIDERLAVGEVAAHEERVVRPDVEVELPVVDRARR